MNQEQVKEKLLQIDSEVADFDLIFSGKESKKVDGLYHPEKKEIIIHNKNFTDDNALVYTAIHEFAHHVQFTQHEGEVTMRSHTVLFWDIFHRLLKKAEELGIYINVFEEDSRFMNLTTEIKEKFLSVNGKVMKDFGKLLIQALDLCQQNHAIFEDYVDRALGMNRNSAKSIMKVYAMDVNPEIGFENMKIIAGVKEPQKRKELEKAFIEGQSQDMVKQTIRKEKPEPVMTVKRLESQKKRIEKSIQAMQVKLADLEMKIDEVKQDSQE
ncbi:hypothetical protein EXM22_06195 [Oceanispirochaeta crateris]|uniref:Uncharacterized protein n=1 Tax=Oceanispirochaeta crateris TaxID=2518645 RepID=A0A5C1QJD9_9SPIO|nr:hypothetical protein [Oceanispirochaeta crateris]QEN07597.1 hypothetical protein EXM22_06195 [Oceanispirochaeta crateris]